MEALGGEEQTQKVMTNGCEYITAWGVSQTKGEHRAGDIVYTMQEASTMRKTQARRFLF